MITGLHCVAVTETIVTPLTLLFPMLETERKPKVPSTLVMDVLNREEALITMPEMSTLFIDGLFVAFLIAGMADCEKPSDKGITQVPLLVPSA